jgi:hypothetical protein
MGERDSKRIEERDSKIRERESGGTGRERQLDIGEIDRRQIGLKGLYRCKERMRERERNIFKCDCILKRFSQLCLDKFHLSEYFYVCLGFLSNA